MKRYSHFDSLDRSDGNGSRSAEEDWLDANTTASENEWSTASTTFYYWEANNANQFKNLYDKHHGKGEGDRDQTIQRSHIVKDAKTFVSLLELPEPQSKQIIKVAREMDFSSKKYGGKPYEKILLAICSLVSDKALSQKIEQDADNPLQRRIILDDKFRELMDVNNLGSGEHNRIRQMLRERSEYF